MNKQAAIAIFLFLLLTTFVSKKKTIISNFKLKKIEIENNYFLEEKDIKKSLAEIYNKNLIFINKKDIESALIKNSLIESFLVKKKYPNTLKLKIFEKKPIAILVNKKKKFYLSDKIEIINFNALKNYNDLPYVFGNKKDFKLLYNNLKKINFPINIIKKYTLYESGRWDIITVNDKIIKLPLKNYNQNLKNYMDIKSKVNFKKYFLFDYRIENQLILK
ncbi:MAG: FtsQ-type POTRA domain-containing protein [Candidatus Pelagibacter sp. TMED286]|nr:MAG: FtsQ-type POTRA domain-containing protein [Candidatus Pelagibacter sp. TMED286]|tara:strand:+ start:1335 stop:1991 length:657 start_codon:yes stop_codon:yes gene_type:complete